ncbi:ATP-binding protein [Pseudomonas sp. 148P]|uniref:histidine kinase n=1 Tax=Pseudomonas ulcerans TaxID=3115852 RepID=A0ABU7HTK2_9PSED|nr:MULTISPECIES: ATP-binding protein [unclassified Pseudomonas]MEE1923258.1 ATP-binding protein [Pseudomonas sp. 147P]MEE1934867.1 ATP-binding protein [Pseudomonas sp. 148P]
MNHSSANSERALILAPPPISGVALSLLDQAGVSALATENLAELADALDNGAGLAIIAHTCLGGFEDSLLKSYLGSQPQWSDLPVVILGDGEHSISSSPELCLALGNLFILPCPFPEQDLLDLTHSSLRARRRQYYSCQQGLELASLQQQTEERVRHLREDEQRLRHDEKMEAIGQLAGGVAHDFNNLLTGIGGSLELIRQRVGQQRFEDIPRLVDMGLNAVQRAASITHRLLAFSSRQSLDGRPVQLAALLERKRVGDLLGPGIRLQLRIDEQLWPAQADARQLQEALDNLLVNARDALPEGGEVRIEVSNRHLQRPLPEAHPLNGSDFVRISVSDNGCGMPQNIVDRAFDPFFTTKPIGQGTGLGLSMVYGFSRQSHGHVSLYSRVGQGTEVELLLPRHHPEDASSPVASASPSRDANASRILVVESNATVRQLVRDNLVEQGYRCQDVADAATALALLRSERPYDLLICNVGLPGMSGRQLADIARKRRSGLRVLFITGYAEQASAQLGHLDPGMQVLNKPFSFEQLKERVARMLAGEGPA